jgi:hypothetical protein
MGYDGAVTRPGKRPSCGYTPLQRIEEERCIAPLVRRSRGAHRAHNQMSSARFGIPSAQPATRPKPCSASHVVAPTPGYNPTGPAGPPVLSCPPDDQPSNPPKRIFRLTARVTRKTPERIPSSSKGELSNAGFPSNSRGVLRPFGASAQASPLHPGLPHRVRSALRVSHPLDGFLLARTPGLVSCRKRPWGFALQGLSLTTRSCQLVAAELPS